MSPLLQVVVILGFICNAFTIAFFASPLASMVRGRDRERERERDKGGSACVCVYTSFHFESFTFFSFLV